MRLEAISIHRRSCGSHVLAGNLPDQAALYGVLLKIDRLGRALLTVESTTEPDKIKIDHRD